MRHRPCHHVMAGALVGAALAAGLVAGPAAALAAPSSPAAAGSGPPSQPVCTPSLFASAQQLVGTELTNRVTRLNTLIGRVTGAADLTPSDRSALLAELTGTELPGIQALQPKVQADTTCLELRHDAEAMVLDYRVYVVMTPQADLVIATDVADHAGGVLAGLEPAISGWISSAQAHGTDVSGAQAAFADYQAKVTAAQGLTSGQSATLLAQVPGGYPGNKSVFLQVRANLANAHADLHAAAADLGEIVGDLQ